MKNEKNNIIEVENLTKIFSDIIAVNSISFGVEKDEIFGFLGPNGAGKTTTIRMLTGLLTPDSGNVLIDDIDIAKDPISAKMKFGVIPEMGNIYVDLTAKQNVVLAGCFYGIPRKELDKKADELLDRFKLLDRRNDPVKTFSKGMKQRVNIASAIVHNPEILFLDEPTSGLDVQSQRLIKEIIIEMNEKGTTVFLTTHNIEEANVLCERVAIINDGRIACIDTPERLKRTFEKIQTVEVAFDRPVDIEPIRAKEFVGDIQKLGGKFKIHTDAPDSVIKYLSDFARERGLVFTSINLLGASLEDAFVRLIEEADDEN